MTSADWPIPSPEEQVQFLRNLQRLLGEGLFVASYKFALIRSLADVAVLKGAESGAPLEIDTKEIAFRFVELYWRQCRPFHVGGTQTGFLLRQNTGKQAAIVAQIADSQLTCGASLFRFKQIAPDQWSQLVADVEQVVRKMPLWKLQTVGDARLDFLYENVGRGNKITLRPGIAYCFRTFYELVRDLIEGSWVRFVQKLNADKLGSTVELGTFLFGQERASLEAYRPILLDVQGGICLYCRQPLLTQSHVDHFIPWSRYPADSGFNFVLAHSRCNNAKSDHLAAEDHLAAWAARNYLHGTEMQSRLRDAALPGDLAAANQVAQWVYRQTEKANGQVWVTKRIMKRLEPGWHQCFAA